MSQYLIIDCETTGVFDYDKAADAPGQPRLCQLGAIWLNKDWTVAHEAEYLIKPSGWVITQEASDVNGFTQEMLEKDGMEIREALIKYASSIDQRYIIAGFNVAYDVKLMRAELRYGGMEDRYMQTRTLCVMQGCRKMVDAKTATGRKKAPSMDEACAYFQIDREPFPHRALGGARACLAILTKLRDMGQMPPWKSPYDKKG